MFTEQDYESLQAEILGLTMSMFNPDIYYPLTVSEIARELIIESSEKIKVEIVEEGASEAQNH